MTKVKKPTHKSIVKDLNSKFGKGTVMLLGSKEVVAHPSVSTGSLGLDKATGIGGFPLGRVVEVYGWESSGKTTLVIHAIAEAQQMGLVAGIVDAEHAFDPQYAANLGVDIDKLIICQPGSGEEALDVVQAMIEQGVQFIAVDSVTALVPQAELNGGMGDSKMGLHARLMSQAMRKLTAKVSRTGTCLVFINQIRLKIGVMFGNPETTTGGNALKFYASMRIEVRRKVKPNQEGGEAASNTVTAHVVKNKLAPPFKKAIFDIRYGTGIDWLGELFDIALDAEWIIQSGSWFSYEDAKIGQGREAALQFLNDNEELTQEFLSRL